MSEITRILNNLDDDASARLMDLVYAELRRLAAARMSREQPGQTMAATGLANEAWIRLVGDETANWESRGHFFAAAAEAMRRILIDRARNKNAAKRGGKFQRAELDLGAIEQAEPDDRILRLDAALAQFEQAEPEKAKLVKLRFFAGCSIREAAEILGVSTATADRHWAYARAWLQTAMQDADD